MSAGLSVLAFAKINLTLDILGRRPDGYHELLSVVQTVSLADRLRIRPTDRRGRLTVTGRWPAPADAGNLCARALRLHQEMYGSGGFDIELDKMIPPASGLGGGSSDAAATLTALRELTGLPADAGALEPLAARLGSDVPLFLRGGAQLIGGRGERLKPLPAPAGPWWLAIARPEFGIGTAEAYANLRPEDFTSGEASLRMQEALNAGAGAEQIASLLHNSFTAGLLARHPRLGELTAALRDAGALAAQITGSGSACFGLFGERQAAEAAARSLTEMGVWSVTARPVPCGQMSAESAEHDEL